MAAGVSLFEPARLMGTSVDQINDTYRHLLPHSIERARTPLDGFLAGAVSSQVDGDRLQDRIGHQLGERGGGALGGAELLARRALLTAALLECLLRLLLLQLFRLRGALHHDLPADPDPLSP